MNYTSKLGWLVNKAVVLASYAFPLACAAVAVAGVDLFLTNDKKLIGGADTGIQFIAGLDSNIL